MTYTVSSDPATLPTKQGDAVRLSITIPSTLTEKRFPLHFLLYSTNNVLYPDVQASGFVEMPLTVTHNASESYYHYNRYITWREYKDMTVDASGTTKTFPCCFKLYKDAPKYTVTVKPSNDDKTKNYFSTSTSISTFSPSIALDALRSVGVYYDFHVDGVSDVRRAVLRMIHNKVR